MTLTGSLRPRLGLAFLTATLASLAAGCGTKETPRYPVTGKVLFEGKPAEHAMVVFHPVGASGPDTVKPTAKVGPDGTFKLPAQHADDGAPAGEYKVSVELWLAGVRAEDPPSNRLPAKYSKPETSGLTATVSAGPNELATFDLKK